ncbi:hypothetical protein DFJ74DRAFT_609336 [Hyaloraphidium curvatum]|nr:hypothetical protein DFJ74DRAFT_609336 [Hyaloraphidium curvatum]
MAPEAIEDKFPQWIPGHPDGQPDTADPQRPDVAGEDCCVCLSALAPREAPSALRTLGCQHTFHAGCVDFWLLEKAACPVCRRSCL